MKPSRFTEEQIVGILRGEKAGQLPMYAKSTGSAVRRSINGRQCGGLALSDAKRLKAIEDENAKVNRRFAEAKLKKAILKQIAARNCDACWQAPGCRPLRSAFEASKWRVCSAR